MHCLKKCRRIFFICWCAAFVVNTLPVHAQVKEAKKTVKTLTSKKYFGRGYVKVGDLKAAQYISHRFEASGLKPLASTYFQEFTMPVNTFPAEMEVRLDSKKLRPGIDFIVNPASAGAQRSYNIFICDSVNLLEKLKAESDDVCLVIMQTDFDRQRKEASSILKEKKTGAVILLEEKKLTWSVATLQYKIPVVTVLRAAFPQQTKKAVFNIDVVFNPVHTTQNVLGIIEGSVIKDSFVVVTAHYDHLGGMGKKTFFPGANDNASGVSMLLNLAQHFSKPENKPSCSMVFIAFAGEEAGLIGSEYYVSHPLFPLAQIKFLINLDLLGTGDDGIMVVNATEYKNEFEKLKAINEQKKYVAKIGERGKAKNSDHYYFSENGVPCFFIYTLGGVSYYHDVFDKAATLPFTDYDDVFFLLRDFVVGL